MKVGIAAIYVAMPIQELWVFEIANVMIISNRDRGTEREINSGHPVINKDD